MRACIFELDISAIAREISSEKIYKPLVKFPAVSRDLSMIVSKKTLVAQVAEQIKDLGGDLLQEVSLFDIFVSSETQERSMAFHMVFSHPDKTLTSQEVDKKIDQIMRGLEDTLSVVIKKN
jgi:phenylalanyl-tRNA synthetase beta chain